MDFVLQYKDPRNMKTALENSVPTQLFDVYTIIMNRINRDDDDSKELAQKILSWIFHAKHPLQMMELRETIAVRKGDVDLDEKDLMPEEELIEVWLTTMQEAELLASRMK